MIQVTDQPIAELDVLQSVKSERAGACLLFTGTTRRFTGEKETESLSYESFNQMAVKELRRLRGEALAKWPLTECSIVHRVGPVAVGETSIAVAVSSPHRSDAFSAAAWIMEQVKKSVPIWKQERWADGTQEWIHPEKTQIHPGESS